jgi:hypothetical protein
MGDDNTHRPLHLQGVNMKLFTISYGKWDVFCTEEDLVIMLGNNLPGENLIEVLDLLDVGDQYGEDGPDGETLNIKRIE